MERHRSGNSDLTVSAIGLGCYGTCQGHGDRRSNRGRRRDFVIHSKSGSPRTVAQTTCAAEAIRAICVKPGRPNLESDARRVLHVARRSERANQEASGMAELVRKARRFIALRCSAVSTQAVSSSACPAAMEFAVLARCGRASQIDACGNSMAMIPMPARTRDERPGSQSGIGSGRQRLGYPAFRCQYREEPGVALCARGHRAQKNASRPASIAWPMAQKACGVLSARYPALNRATILWRMRAPRTLCSQPRILRKSTASSRPVPRPELATR